MKLENGSLFALGATALIAGAGLVSQHGSRVFRASPELLGWWKPPAGMKDDLRRLIKLKFPKAQRDPKVRADFVLQVHRMLQALAKLDKVGVPDAVRMKAKGAKRLLAEGIHQYADAREVVDSFLMVVYRDLSERSIDERRAHSSAKAKRRAGSTAWDDDDEGEEDESAPEPPDQDELDSAAVITEPAWGKIGVSFDGRFVGHAKDADDALRMVRKLMKQHNYYPNIYFVNERGNVTLVDDKGNELASWV